MRGILLIALGSALGGLARHGIAVWFAHLAGEAFPWGTLLINITGSFVIGLWFTLTASGGRILVDPDWRAFVTVGLCGGYTTFSSFSLQTLALLQRGEALAAGAYVLGSVALSLLAVWGGVFIGAKG